MGTSSLACSQQLRPDANDFFFSAPRFIARSSVFCCSLLRRFLAPCRGKAGSTAVESKPRLKLALEGVLRLSLPSAEECACPCVRVSAGLFALVGRRYSTGGSLILFSTSLFTREQKWWIYPLSTPSKMPRKPKTEVRALPPAREHVSSTPARACLHRRLTKC